VKRGDNRGKVYAPYDRIAPHRCTNWDFTAVLVSRLGNIEHRKNRHGGDEQCGVYEVTPRTDSLAGTKCERDRWVVSECPVIVEKSLRLECFGIRIEFWIV